jgi:hypothetical protein
VKYALAVVVALVGCRTHQKREESAVPMPVASCDYQTEAIGGGTNHRCLDIFDSAAVTEQEGFCKELVGPRDHATFKRGESCATADRKGGCLYPNGTIEWFYSGEPACVAGRKFEERPKVKVASPYRCTTPKLCSEVMSVINLSETTAKQSCGSIGGTFEAELCSADNVAGRCMTKERTRDTRWVYYRPTMTFEQAKRACEAMKGSFSP